MLSIVIPVYNEKNTILEILRQVQAAPFEKQIIIVDDGSSDGTRELLKNIQAPNITVLFNEKNRGKGFSLRRGFEKATGDIVIIQDADLEYYPDEYGLLIKNIIDKKADVVYGTRFYGARRVFHFYHYLGNKLLNGIANILYDANLSDLMTCYKAFRADALKKLRLCADGFGIEAEITAQVFKHRMRVYEVPISYNGRDYDEGKKITARDFFRSVGWLLRCLNAPADIGAETLYQMKALKNNNRWLLDQITPYLGKNILEVGSGIGNLSHLLTAPLAKPGQVFILTDINDTYLESLRAKFIGNPDVVVLKHDIAADDPGPLAARRIDTIVNINVLEHIPNDDLALSNMFRILAPGGRLLLAVPALKFLHGTLDKNLDHVRRYEKDELRAKLEKNKFLVEKISFHNALATAGWYLNGRVLRRKMLPGFQGRCFDALVPLLKKLENKLRLPFGLSLIAICKKS